MTPEAEAVRVRGVGGSLGGEGLLSGGKSVRDGERAGQVTVVRNQGSCSRFCPAVAGGGWPLGGDSRQRGVSLSRAVGARRRAFAPPSKLISVAHPSTTTPPAEIAPSGVRLLSWLPGGRRSEKPLLLSTLSCASP